MEELKIYSWCGFGLALGSEIIVVAKGINRAINLISEEMERLDVAWKNAPIEESNIKIKPFEPNSIIYSWDGEY